MGFSAVSRRWSTTRTRPSPAANRQCGNILTDRGKSGYRHWGVNFFRVDEHLPSPGMDSPTSPANFTAAA